LIKFHYNLLIHNYFQNIQNYIHIYYNQYSQIYGKLADEIKQSQAIKLIIDILQEITTLPIVLTLEIETDLETGTITNPIIIIDPEVEANLAIGIDLGIVLLIITETTDLEADLLLLILGMSILLIPLVILPMKNLKLS